MLSDLGACGGACAAIAAKNRTVCGCCRQFDLRAIGKDCVAGSRAIDAGRIAHDRALTSTRFDDCKLCVCRRREWRLIQVHDNIRVGLQRKRAGGSGSAASCALPAGENDRGIWCDGQLDRYPAGQGIRASFVASGPAGNSCWSAHDCSSAIPGKTNADLKIAGRWGRWGGCRFSGRSGAHPSATTHDAHGKKHN